MLNVKVSKAINKSEDVTTSASEVLAANENRVFAILCNTEGSAGETIYLSLSQTAVAEEGITLQPGQRFEISYMNPYLGAISAIATGACKLSIVEAS